MEIKRRSRQSFLFPHGPVILSRASAAGKKESQGPLGGTFDRTARDTTWGRESWEKAESQMQTVVRSLALEKAGLREEDLDAAFVGDLLNQCIGSSFSMRNLGIPTLGLYGACSTMAESLLLGAMAVDGGYCSHVLALTSSHFASAERQYRFPLGYGGQRTPTAQWTVTGAGALILGREGRGPRITGATVGAIRDRGIRDPGNMGAAMAPAAFETIRAHFRDFGTGPEDYDFIVTGDLGALGSQLVRELFLREENLDLGRRYEDCGLLIYHRKAQDVHCGGSGAGCSACVLCGFLLDRLKPGQKLLFCGTGALLSPMSTQQGESIPAVCHAVVIAGEEVK